MVKQTPKQVTQDPFRLAEAWFASRRAHQRVSDTSGQESALQMSKMLICEYETKQISGEFSFKLPVREEGIEVMSPWGRDSWRGRPYNNTARSYFITKDFFAHICANPFLHLCSLCSDLFTAQRRKETTNCLHCFFSLNRPLPLFK